MKIEKLPKNMKGGKALSPLVFNGINDTPDNPRLGLGYHQLYDPTVPVSLIAKLPDVTRPGDTITLYWDNSPVQNYDLDQPTIEKGWLSFSVLPAHIFDPVGNTYYTLLDHEANDLQTSDTRTIPINRRPPGGLDPDPSTSINEALRPATITPAVISDVSVAVTVTVEPWTYMETGDELTILWNGYRVDHPVLTVPPLAPQTVTIPRSILEQGGNSSKLPVTYEIRDIVDNYSLISPTAFADVDIDPAAIGAPRVREANLTTLILDLAALGDNDAHVMIPHYAGITQNDKVTLTWVGKTANSAVTLKLGPLTVGDPEFDPLPVFDIPNAHMKSISGGSALVSYDVQQAAGALHSKRTAITITGLLVPLLKPVIEEANGTAVIDLQQLTGPTVNVVIEPYPGKKAGDKINLIWTGTPLIGPPSHYTDEYDVNAGEETRTLIFEVNRINLDPLLDGSLRLIYQVIFTQTTSPQDSDPMVYTVAGASSVREDFTGQLPKLIRQNDSIDTGKILITFESGPGDAGFPLNDNLPINPGPISLPMFHVCFQNSSIKKEDQKLRVDLKIDCKTFACDVHGLNSASTTIQLLSSTLAVLATFTPSQTNFHLEYTTTAALIRYVSIDAKGDWSRWDNFVMTP